MQDTIFYSSHANLRQYELYYILFAASSFVDYRHYFFIAMKDDGTDNNMIQVYYIDIFLNYIM